MTALGVVRKVAALALVAAVAGAAVLTYHAYRGSFRDSVEIAVESGRAGLAMRVGALVKYHGVEVGRVSAISHDARAGAVVTARLTHDGVASVPAGVGAEIKSTTVFGEKYLTLTDPRGTARGVGRSIAPGTVIGASAVTVEIDSVFESLTQLLSAIAPEKLDATLSAIAAALRGNGADLGRAIDDTNAVLAQLNPRLPALRHDLRATAETASIYADAADDLAAGLTNAATTADTLVAQGDGFDRTLLSLIGMADTGNDILTTNGEPLTSAIGLLRPTTDLLGRYAPVLTCFLQGADRARRLAEPVTGGNGSSMLLRSTLLLGTDPYTYPDNLPVVGATGGPRCGALPEVTLSEVPTPFVVADIGAFPFEGDTGGPRLVPGSILNLLFPSPGAPR
ncbi:MCE family protein [Nocardia callitridis]|uniref:MCE family protein n=1 Tax=Nocardia callitridis TaxID=648753 RepID=A0ABP9KCH0_9NOCA